MLSAPRSPNLPSRTHTPTPSAGRARGVAGSAASTETQTQTAPVLRLRGASSGPAIRWATDVVDNEGLGRKKSKGRQRVGDAARLTLAVCCIYHAPRGIDSSSDGSSDASESESDDDDDGAARPTRREGARDAHSVDDALPEADGGADCEARGAAGTEADHPTTHGEGKGSQRQRPRSPNAYEKMPRRRSERRT
jgi:protein phosphatase 1 regulatory subunit 11